MSKPIQRQSLTDLTVDALLQLVQDEGLRAGDALPATADLASTLQVSRPVVREAIAELAGQGLVLRRQGKEPIVQLPGPRDFENLLRHRLSISGAGLTDIQDYREIAEVGAAQLAAQRATPVDIQQMEKALTMLRQVPSEEQLHDLDIAFHREVARAAKNEMLLLTLDGIAPILKELRVEAWRGWKCSGGDVQTIIEAHALILERIVDHDPEGAGSAMRDHLEQAKLGLNYSINSKEDQV